jgi:DNA-binding transcriptional regulator GbsR (MarR family)
MTILLSFSIGERVRVKETIKQGNLPDGLYVSMDMQKLAGLTFTIGEIKGNNRYALIEATTWTWSGELLQKIDTQKINNELGENKMELKDIKSENLREATLQVKQEKMNEEIEFAKKEYKKAKDELDKIDRTIKQLQEQKNPHLEILAKFK